MVTAFLVNCVALWLARAGLWVSLICFLSAFVRGNMPMVLISLAGFLVCALFTRLEVSSRE